MREKKEEEEKKWNGSKRLTTVYTPFTITRDLIYLTILSVEQSNKMD